MRLITLARLSAAVAAGGAVAGAVRAGRLLAGTPDQAVALWMAVPVGCALGLVVFAGRRSVAAVWIPIGAYVCFVILTGFSLGPFFARPSIFMLAAGALHAGAEPRLKLAFAVPFWLLLGGSSLGPLLYAAHELQAAASGGRNIEAPVLLYMCAVFAGLMGALGLATWMRDSKAFP